MAAVDEDARQQTLPTPTPTTTSPETGGAESSAPAFTPEQVWAHLCANVQGTPVAFTDENVALSTDWAKVRKYYKLNGASALAGIKDETARRKESEMLILSAMALRGV